MMVERLKHYEALLQERGIDPNQMKNTSEAERYGESSRPAPGTVPPLQTASTVPVPHAAHFKPQLLHGPTGTRLADK
jgi:hypothetical protein